MDRRPSTPLGRALDRKARPLIEAQVRNVEKMETATRPDFQDLYVAAMAIPRQKSPDKI